MCVAIWLCVLQVSASGRKLKGRGIMVGIHIELVCVCVCVVYVLCSHLLIYWQRFHTPPKGGDDKADTWRSRDYGDRDVGRYSGRGRAFSRSPIRRESPHWRRESPYRNESPYKRRGNSYRRDGPSRRSRSRSPHWRNRGHDYRSQPLRRHSRDRYLPPARDQSSSPGEYRRGERESRWDSHVKQERERDQESRTISQHDRSPSNPEKLVVVSKWVRRHSNNESE